MFTVRKVEVSWNYNDHIVAHEFDVIALHEDGVVTGYNLLTPYEFLAIDAKMKLWNITRNEALTRHVKECYITLDTMRHNLSRNMFGMTFTKGDEYTDDMWATQVQALLAMPEFAPSDPLDSRPILV